MDRIIRFIFGSRHQPQKQRVIQSAESKKMTIEETIRRYEQLCAK